LKVDVVVVVVVVVVGVVGVVVVGVVVVVVVMVVVVEVVVVIPSLCVCVRLPCSSTAFSPCKPKMISILCACLLDWKKMMVRVLNERSARDKMILSRNCSLPGRIRMNS